MKKKTTRVTKPTPAAKKKTKTTRRTGVPVATAVTAGRFGGFYHS